MRFAEHAGVARTEGDSASGTTGEGRDAHLVGCGEYVGGCQADRRCDALGGSEGTDPLCVTRSSGDRPFVCDAVERGQASRKVPRQGGFVMGQFGLGVLLLRRAWTVFGKHLPWLPSDLS